MSKLSSRGPAWEALRKRVLDRDLHTCHYCQGPATTVDHVVAKANGGMDSMDNLVAACLQCNGRKGAKARVRQPWFNPRWLEGLS